MAKIIEVQDNLLKFDDGTVITCDHEQHYCEYNYAKFEDIDSLCRKTDFDTENLAFEKIDGSGFRFGNFPFKMFFVPCYSLQNGYYSDMLDVYVNGKKVLSLICEGDYC